MPNGHDYDDPYDERNIAAKAKRDARSARLLAMERICEDMGITEARIDKAKADLIRDAAKQKGKEKEDRRRRIRQVEQELEELRWELRQASHG